MVASVRNGFRQIVWDPKNFSCNGRPYAFHPMYDRALPPTRSGQPTAWTTWAAHTDNVAYDVETGHFEPPDASSDSPLSAPDEDPPCFTTGVIPGLPRLRRRLRRLPVSPRRLAGRDVEDADPELRQLAAEPGPRLLSDCPLRDRPAADRGGGQRGRAHLRPPHGRWLQQPAAGCLLPVVPSALPSLPKSGGCTWGLTNDMPGPQREGNFGGEQAAWGPLEQTDYGFDKRFHNYARTIQRTHVRRGAAALLSPSDARPTAAPHGPRSPLNPIVRRSRGRRRTPPWAGRSWWTRAGGLSIGSPPETTRHLLCTRACTHTWPPLTVASRRTKLRAGPGVHGRLGVFRRPDGRLQVTLRGFPLYRFSGDRTRDAANGTGRHTSRAAPGRCSCRMPPSCRRTRPPPGRSRRRRPLRGPSSHPHRRPSRPIKAASGGRSRGREAGTERACAVAPGWRARPCSPARSA